jgi:hypothetical protein
MTDISLAVGVGLGCALLSALGTNLAFLVKHRGAVAAPDVDMRHPLRSAVDLFRSRWWSIGWAVAAVAFALHVAALTLAPISIGQAVLAGGLVFLAVLATTSPTIQPPTSWPTSTAPRTTAMPMMPPVATRRIEPRSSFVRRRSRPGTMPCGRPPRRDSRSRRRASRGASSGSGSVEEPSADAGSPDSGTITSEATATPRPAARNAVSAIG